MLTIEQIDAMIVAIKEIHNVGSFVLSEIVDAHILTALEMAKGNAWSNDWTKAPRDGRVVQLLGKENKEI